MASQIAGTASLESAGLGSGLDAFGEPGFVVGERGARIDGVGRVDHFADFDFGRHWI
jgi:hypothetical protein